MVLPPPVDRATARSATPIVTRLWTVTLTLTGTGVPERVTGSVSRFCHRHGPGSVARYDGSRVQVRYVDEGLDGETVARSALTWARELRNDLGTSGWRLAGLEVLEAVGPDSGSTPAPGSTLSR